MKQEGKEQKFMTVDGKYSTKCSRAAATLDQITEDDGSVKMMNSMVVGKQNTATCWVCGELSLYMQRVFNVPTFFAFPNCASRNTCWPYLH